MSDDDLVLYGVTHRVEVSPVEDDRWDYMLIVESPAGRGEALLTPDECYRLRDYLLNGRDPGFGTYVDDRCRCSMIAHEKYGDDCLLVPLCDVSDCKATRPHEHPEPGAGEVESLATEGTVVGDGPYVDSTTIAHHARCENDDRDPTRLGATHPNHWTRHGHPGRPCPSGRSCYGGAQMPTPSEPDAGEACPAIHSTNPCTICEMPASIQSADDRAEQIAQELERRARVARTSKAAVPDDFERADVTRGNFDQQAWAFEQAARVARGLMGVGTSAEASR